MKSAKPIRWNIETAAREFGLDRRTVAQRLSAAGITSAPDGKFSTADIHCAICGDLEAAKLRKVKEEADKVALENDKTRGSLVEVEAVYNHFQGVYVAFRARILASALTDTEKDEILAELRRLKARDIFKAPTTQVIDLIPPEQL